MLREQRKRDHVRHALDGTQVNSTGFDDVHFVHQSLPDRALTQCSLSTQIGELNFGSPFLINAMTGGAPEVAVINRELARAASQFGMPMAVGSQRNALVNPSLSDTYQVVREENPHGIVFANLGAGATAADAQKAVEMIRADALQLHLNVPQELVMPEGDRDFQGILGRIEQVVNNCSVPVIVKEVGFGMSRETIRLLAQTGVSAIDIAGHGGTNFIQIENRRADRPFELLETWGQSTVISLLEAYCVSSKPAIIGSGGVRTAVDAAKCLALGACLVGAAGFWLQVWNELGYEGLVTTLQTWHDQLRLIMTLLGCASPADLRQVPMVITGFSAEWCRARGIKIEELAGRPG
ncbi:MAG: type 2 isopentenyl-diphosphate Delta-isomerase [Bacilli bacterium]|nr:type 2 isopentenyl-diphosphate Delta-isomerase [Bacilli bacterium]